MAERPLVINAKVINLLNAAPVTDLRPALGSLIQRKTVDVGCYPFPFMVNQQNIPLDGRVVGGVTLDIRPVPYWCSENAYAQRYGDSTYNNGFIVWNGNVGSIVAEDGRIIVPVAFRYDSELGVTYPTQRINTVFSQMDTTVPEQWENIRNAFYASPGSVVFNQEQGETFAIASHSLFKAWSGLTYELREGGGTYAFVPMNQYIAGGGTASSIFQNYGFPCLDQIFNNEGILSYASGDPASAFFEGSGYGLSFGVSGGITGEKFLLNAVYGGPGNENSAGSFYLENAGSCADFPYTSYFEGAAAGATFSGKQLAINIYKTAFQGPAPFLKPEEPYQHRSFIDTMALLLGTQQKIVTLVTGGTASIRTIDFNNPCSSSFFHREDTELGKWGYDTQRLTNGIGDGEGSGTITVDYGCNVPTFNQYLSGPSAALNGIPHPLSWMFWRNLSSDTPAQGFVHDYVGVGGDGEPQYNKLEGIHDHLCYELLDGTEVVSRVYYPIRPITSGWYNTNVKDSYALSNPGYAFGLTLDKKYQTGFDEAFGGPGGVEQAISLQYLFSNSATLGLTFSFPAGVVGLTGVMGVMFPYMLPIASLGMSGMSSDENSSLVISGEFEDNFSSWTRDSFGVAGLTPPDGRMYPYFADGVSSAASFSGAGQPYYTSENPLGYNFNLFSWDALSKIRPKRVDNGEELRSSFRSVTGDFPGSLIYSTTSDGKQKITMDGGSVSVNPLDFPPRALSTSSTDGLALTAGARLGCDSYVNLIRYANNTDPRPSTIGEDPPPPGLTASRTLIASKNLSADATQDFSDFDDDDTVDTTDQVFDRSGEQNNDSNNFYEYQTAQGNFFFNTESSLAVFGSPYYLSSEQYYQKYVLETVQENWWENATYPYLTTIDALVDEIYDKLISPNDGDKWASGNNFRFKNAPHDSVDGTVQYPLFRDGIKIAIQNRKIHPAFVYRVFTTAAMTELEDFEGRPIYFDCSGSWTVQDTNNFVWPCHKYPPLLEKLATDFSYFSTGETGCGKYGETDDEFLGGSDFFYKNRLSQDIPGQPGAYAFAAPYYYPLPAAGNSYAYQNDSCGVGGANISDPPSGATLTELGLSFARALGVVNNTTIDFNSSIEVRNLFGFPGNTATATLEGEDNIIETPISDWLQNRLEETFEFYNTYWPNPDSGIEIVKSFLSGLYGETFDAYAEGLADTKTYRLWAIKPRCVDEYDPDCQRLANILVTGGVFNPQRLAAIGGGVFNSGSKSTFGRPTLGGPVSGSILSTTATTENTPVRDGFLSAFQTLYVEPLGRAPNVLATQAQAVSRATIRSTVFGKLISVIDSRGMLRDANVIALESGFGTKITGNTGSNSITISVDGLSLGSLTDVASVAATDGDVLSYDLVGARWTNRSLYDLNDMHAGMRYIFSDATEPLFDLNIGQVTGEDLTRVLANAGTLKFNTKSDEIPTEVYFSVSDSNGNDQTELFNRFGTGVAGTLLLKKFGDPNAFYRFQVDGLTGPYAERSNAVAADTGLRVSLVNSGTGTLSAGDRLAAFLFLEPATNRVNFYYQALPPTGAGVTGGSRWMNSETGTEYIYINDGDTNQWVQAV